MDTVPSDEDWTNWHWQQRNSLRSSGDIRRFFPKFPAESIEQVAALEKKYRFSLTPHILQLIQVDSYGNPRDDDPLWKQFFPSGDIMDSLSSDTYDGEHVNWELQEDFPTPILQHKYPNKAIFRMVNECFSYCNYCFEVERTMDKGVKKPTTTEAAWKQSIAYIRDNPHIEDVILSGGDPLMASNETLDARLSSLRALPSVRSVRVNTRALTFNPYRFDYGLVEVMKRHHVTALGIHVAHPREVTPEFTAALRAFDEHGYGSILKLGQIPLVKGVNDDVETLRELFMTLYGECGVIPYYLLHDMPWTPGAESQRTSVKKGVELLSAMKNRISNVAIPEYIIVHHTGKKTVPLEVDGTPEFAYGEDGEGNPIINFRNWKGNWETYLDGRD